MVDMHTQSLQRTKEAENEALEAQTKDWQKEVAKDKVLGKVPEAEREAVFTKAINAFGTPELTEALEKTGMRSHPEMQRLLYNIGLEVSEDSSKVNGKTAGTEKTTAQVLYGNK